jgi:hypothetical protein
MNLISLVNSGESIEKTLVLFESAMKYNADFYKGFDKVTLFYDENLSKHRNASFPHGSVGANLNFLSKNYDIKYKSEDDLWNDRGYILKTLGEKNRISERSIEKLDRNFSRYIKVVNNLPMELIDNFFYEILLRNFLSKYPFVNIVKLNLRNDFEIFLDNLPNDNAAQLHALDTEGSIGNRVFQTPLELKDRTSIVNYVNKSVIVSGNIYIFMMKIVEHLKTLDNNSWTVACRQKSLSSRNASQTGFENIEKLNSYAIIAEPKNDYFNELLNASKEQCISTENLVNKAVYKGLLEFTK